MVACEVRYQPLFGYIDLKWRVVRRTALLELLWAVLRLKIAIS